MTLTIREPFHRTRIPVFFVTLTVSILVLALLVFIIVARRLPHLGPGPPEYFEAETIDVGESPDAIAQAFGSIWVTNAGDGTVSRIDPYSDQVEHVIDVGARPVGLAVTTAAVWVIRTGGDVHPRGTISRISPTNNEVTDVIRLGRAPVAVTSVFDSIWVANARDRTIMKIDAVARRVTGSLPVEGRPVDLAVSEDGLWVARQAGAGSRSILNRIDLTTGQPDRRALFDDAVSCLTATSDAVYLCEAAGDEQGTVIEVNPSTGNVVRELTELVDPRDVAVDGSVLFVSEASEDRVAVLRTYSSEIVEHVGVGSHPGALIGRDGGAWVTNRDDATVSRIEHRIQ